MIVVITRWRRYYIKWSIIIAWKSFITSHLIKNRNLRLSSSNKAAKYIVKMLQFSAFTRRLVFSKLHFWGWFVDRLRVQAIHNQISKIMKIQGFGELLSAFLLNKLKGWQLSSRQKGRHLWLWAFDKYRKSANWKNTKVRSVANICAGPFCESPKIVNDELTKSKVLNSNHRS